MSKEEKEFDPMEQMDRETTLLTLFHEIMAAFHKKHGRLNDYDRYYFADYVMKSMFTPERRVYAASQIIHDVMNHR